MNRLQERRMALGLTQPQVSARLKETEPRADVGMVSRYEKGVCLPTADQLKALEDVLGASRTELYDSEDLDLLSRMSKDSGVTTRDNGVSQEVEARQGVSLKALVQVKPRVALRPFRTFLKVEQPVSEFLLRLDDDGNVGLFEADGGMWQQTAKASIAAYFEDKLAQEVKDGKIVVMM